MATDATPEWLDDSQVAHLLGVSVRTLERMVDEDGFPDGLVFRGNTKRWLREDLLFWRLLLERRPRIRETKSTTDADRGRLSGTTDDKL